MKNIDQYFIKNQSNSKIMKNFYLLLLTVLMLGGVGVQKSLGQITCNGVTLGGGATNLSADLASITSCTGELVIPSGSTITMPNNDVTWACSKFTIKSGGALIFTANKSLIFSTPNAEIVIEDKRITASGNPSGHVLAIQGSGAGGCASANQGVSINGSIYAICNPQANSSCLSLLDLVAQGGTSITISSVSGVNISSNNIACKSFSILAAVQAATSDINVTYSNWQIIGPSPAITVVPDNPTIINNSTTGVVPNKFFNSEATFSVTQVGTYTVKVTASTSIAGCTGSNITATKTITVIVSEPTATLAVSGSPSCANGSQTFTVTNTNAYGLAENISYNIKNSSDVIVATGTVPSNLAAGATSAPINLPTGTAGTYTVTLTTGTFSTSPGCTASNLATGTYTVNPLPTIMGNLTTCIGQTTELTGSGTPASLNPWVSASTDKATITTAGLVTGKALGTSVITYTDNNGCQATATVNVTNGAPATPGTITGPTGVCAGSNATYSITAVPNTNSYTWAAPSGWMVTSGQGTTSITVTAGQGAVNGNITVSGTNSCATSGVGSLMVTVNPLPELTVADPAAVCSPAKVDVTTAAVQTTNTGTTTNYYSTNVLAMAGGAGDIADPTMIAASGTVYIRSELATGCYVIKSVMVTVNPLPTCLITGTDLPICPAAEVTYSGPANMKAYKWTISGNASIKDNIDDMSSVMIIAGTKCNDEFILSLEVTSEDDCKKTCEITRLVIDETAPEITNCPENFTEYTGDGREFCDALVYWTEPLATDICSQEIKWTKSYMHESASTETIFTGVVDISNPLTFLVGTTTVTYIAEDVCGNKSTCSFEVVVEDNTAPVLDKCPTEAVTGVTSSTATTCEAEVQLPSIKVKDNCTAIDDIKIVWQITGPAPTATGTGALASYIFPVGTSTVYTTYEDLEGNSIDCSYDVIVTDATPPAISCPANITVNNDGGKCGAIVTYTAPTGTDNCLGANTMQIGGLASGALFPVGTTTNIFEVTDSAGLKTSCSFTVIVKDAEVPKIVTCPAKETIEGCSTDAIEPLVYSETAVEVTSEQFAAAGGMASDNCGIVKYTYIDSKGGTCPIMVSRIWTVTDAAGKATNCMQTIEIDDTTAPEIAGSLPEITVEGCGIADLPTAYTTVTALETAGMANQLEISDACTEKVDLKVTFKDSEPSGTCPIVVTRTYSVTDACENVSEIEQVITIADTKAPTWSTTLNSLDRNVSCDKPADLAAAQMLFPAASDVCGLNNSTFTKVSGVFTPNLVGCTTTGTYTNTWTVKDICGNTSTTFTQVITIVDNVPPTIVMPASFINTIPIVPIDMNNNVTLNTPSSGCVFVLPFNKPTLSDNCTSVNSISIIVTAKDKLNNEIIVSDQGINYIANFPLGVNTLTYTVSDLCGNTVVKTITVTIVDNIKPAIPTIANFTGCGVVPIPTTTDNCSGIIYGTTANPTEYYKAGTYQIQWVFTDVSGNSVTAIQQVIITGSGVITGSVVKDLTPVNSLVDGDLQTTVIAHVSLVKGSVIVATVPVTAGLYTLPDVCAGTYNVVLHTTAGGSTSPQLPAGYGGFVSDGKLNGVPDASPNGVAQVTISSGALVYGNARVAAGGDVSFGLGPQALPVRLISFTGKSIDTGNELTWKTSSEQNFSHYEVERSLDGQAFEQIDKVSGASSNSTEILSYTYLDKNQNSGMVPGANTSTNIGNLGAAYYRLKMIDLDGSNEYSKVIYVESKEKPSIVGEFYPNPAFGNEVKVDITAKGNSLWTITAYDLSGRIVNIETLTLDKGLNNVKIDLTKARNGISIFKFENAEGVQYRKLNK